MLDSRNLSRLPLFSGLTEEETAVFLKKTGTTMRQFPKGSRILRAYEPNTYIGILARGEAIVIAEDRFGNEAVTHTLEGGAIFGSTSAILPDFGNHSSIEARTEVEVLWLPYRALLVTGPRLGRTHGIVMKNLLETFSTKLILMMQKIELLSQKTLRERLILYLLQRGKRQESSRVKVPGRVQLAKELECNRSALTREISLMKEAGMLACGADWMELDEEKIG